MSNKRGNALPFSQFVQNFLVTLGGRKIMISSNMINYSPGCISADENGNRLFLLTDIIIGLLYLMETERFWTVYV
ncbi:unnamed protein product [Prunus brigantina]